MDYCIGDVRFENLEAALRYLVETGEEGCSQEIFCEGDLVCTATPGVTVDGRVGIGFPVIQTLDFTDIGYKHDQPYYESLEVMQTLRNGKFVGMTLGQ
jgi:hypothetical protein